MVHQSAELEHSERQQVNLIMNLGEVLLNQGKLEDSVKYCDDALRILGQRPTVKPASMVKA